MKKVFSPALLGLLSFMVFSINACSSDDEIGGAKQNEETGIVINEKKLTKLVIESSTKFSTYTDTYTFEYDNKGRLSKVNNNEQNYYISWGDDLVSSPWYDGIYESTNKTNYTYTLTNGRVIKAIKEYTAYSGSTPSKQYVTRNYIYDDERRLFKVEENDSYYNNQYNTTHSYTWVNNQLKKYMFKASESYTYTYSDKTCKGFCPTLNDKSQKYHDEILFMVHPELIGMRKTQLPDKIESDYNTIWTYSYTFDKENYISNVIETRIDDNEKSGIIKYNYTWK